MVTTKKKTTTKKKPLKRSTELRKADTAFSLFIRTRDSQEYEGRYFKCISCGRVLPIEEGDNGHYICRANMSLRYNEMNNHAQCIRDNRFDEGAISDYRRGLVKLYGEEEVQKLEDAKHVIKKMSANDLHEIAEYYKAKVKEFEFQIK